MELSKCLTQKNVFSENAFIPGCAYLIQVNSESLAAQYVTNIMADLNIDNLYRATSRDMQERLMKGSSALFYEFREKQNIAVFIMTTGKYVFEFCVDVETIEHSITQSETVICTPDVMISDMVVMGIDLSNSSS